MVTPQVYQCGGPRSGFRHFREVRNGWARSSHHDAIGRPIAAGRTSKSPTKEKEPPVNTRITRCPRALTLAAHLFTAAGALAGSDFNGDGIQDLAIGVPNESVGNLFQAGI